MQAEPVGDLIRFDVTCVWLSIAEICNLMCLYDLSFNKYFSVDVAIL